MKSQPKYRQLRLAVLLPILLLANLPVAQATASKNQALLRCNVTYAGGTQIVETSVSKDPYVAPIHDIGGRFSFKAVMIGDHKKLNYIKLYAYLQGRDVDVPIHQATYKDPIQIGRKMRALTPINYLYAGEVERELQYQCFLGLRQQ